VLSEALSYVSRRDPFWKRWTMRAIENLSGRRRLLPIYHRWRATVAAGTNPRMMAALLDMIAAPGSMRDEIELSHGWQGCSRRLKDTAFFGVRALWT
jgi:hypothetical protein